MDLARISIKRGYFVISALPPLCHQVIPCHLLSDPPPPPQVMTSFMNSPLWQLMSYFCLFYCLAQPQNLTHKTPFEKSNDQEEKLSDCFRQISVDSSRLAPFPRYSINSFTFLFTKIFSHVIVEYSQQDLFLMNCLLKTGLCFLKSKILAKTIACRFYLNNS